MAGPTQRAVYTADDLATYCVRLPSWEATLNGGATACTTEPALPAGIRRRKRYYRITATGKEGSITVLAPDGAMYTSSIGTAVTVPQFGAAVPGAPNATLSGRTGERLKDV